MTTLTQELALQPYQGLSDHAAAELLNARTIEVDGEADGPSIQRAYVVMAVGDDPAFASGSVADAISTAAAQPGGVIARIIRAVFDKGLAVNFASADVQALAAAAVSQGLFTQAQADRLRALGKHMISRADQLGLAPVTHQMVAEARNG